MNNLRVTFHMDGTGVAMWPKQPVHLDGLLAYCLIPLHKIKTPISPNEEPYETNLPLDKWHIGGTWGWSASALFPDGEFYETTQFYRKRFNINRLHLLPKSNIVTQGMRYGERNIPMPLLLCRSLIAYCVGNKEEIYRLLKRNITYIGMGRGKGKGRINDISVDNIDNNYSIVKNDRAMRFLPVKNGLRFGRIRPPYHNNCSSINSCYPLDEWNN